MASFRNLLGLPVKDWDSRATDGTEVLVPVGDHWEFKKKGGSPLTTKGDLYGYDTGNARIPVGTDGQVLVADSSKALGVKWAEGNGIHIDDRVATYASLPSPPTEGAGATYLVDADGLLYVWDGSSWPAEGAGRAVGASGLYMRVYFSAPHNSPSGNAIWSPIPFNAVDVDTHSIWDAVNFQATIPADGLYWCGFGHEGPAVYAEPRIYLNGAEATTPSVDGSHYYATTGSVLRLRTGDVVAAGIYHVGSVSLNVPRPAGLTVAAL